jgi:eukaryotic-like serine/threonine-protein kinase
MQPLRAFGYHARVKPLDLAATFEQRWHTLALGETVAAFGATIRPTRSPAAILEAHDGAGLLPAQLPRISLDISRESLLETGTPPQLADLSILTTLGEGGMGRVHLAHQRSLGREVAVKTLKPGADDHAHQALLAEAAISGALEHPAIIPVHALGIDDTGRPVLVMKRVEGTEWRQLILDAEHPVWSDVPDSGDRLGAHLGILMQVCNAVHFAHSRGVVHRDIKPENVMIGRYGEVYLVDWGVATRIETQRPGDLVGSPGYMAPEMVAGEVVDARTDVYLLGATLHEVLTGGLRHGGETIYDVLLAAFRSEPHAYGDDVPGELADLCNRATHRDPAERPESALELRRAVAEFLRHRSSIALADAARLRLGELRQMLTATRDDAPLPDAAPAYRLMTECRFGLVQALEQWPENRAARANLAACLETMVDVELRQGNASAAAALLSELEEPPAELSRRLRELERLQADRRARDERLRQLEHDLDPGIGARERSRGLLALGVIAMAISGFALSRDPEQIGPGDLVVFALIMCTGLLIGLVIYHRQVLTNAFNRRGAGLVVVAVLGLTTNRFVGFLQDSPTQRTFTQDLLIMTVVGASGTVMLDGWMWPVALCYAAALVLGLSAPAWLPMIFSGSAVLGIALVILIWRRRVRPSP